MDIATTTTPTTPAQSTKPKLSIAQAILRGCKLNPFQAQGANVEYMHYATDADNEPHVRTCARGAAVLGTFDTDEELTYQSEAYYRIFGHGSPDFRYYFGYSETNLPTMHLPPVYHAGPNAQYALEEELGDSQRPGRECDLESAMIILNDTWGWTREEIAAYFQTAVIVYP